MRSINLSSPVLRPGLPRPSSASDTRLLSHASSPALFHSGPACFSHASSPLEEQTGPRRLSDPTPPSPWAQDPCACAQRVGHSGNRVTGTQALACQVHSLGPCRLRAGPGSPHERVGWAPSGTAWWTPAVSGWYFPVSAPWALRRGRERLRYGRARRRQGLREGWAQARRQALQARRAASGTGPTCACTPDLQPPGRESGASTVLCPSPAGRVTLRPGYWGEKPRARLLGAGLCVIRVSSPVPGGGCVCRPYPVPGRPRRWSGVHSGPGRGGAPRFKEQGAETSVEDSLQARAPGAVERRRLCWRICPGSREVRGRSREC